MKLLLLSMLATAAFSPAKTTNIQAGDWTFSAHPDSNCALDANGNALDAFGATLSLACAADAPQLAKVAAKVGAAHLRQKRITLSGDVQNVPGASLWVKVVRGGKTLALESTTEESAYEDTADAAWLHRSITVAVPSEASAISFGLLLQGGSEAEVRNLRLTVSGEGAASAGAQQVLDAAIAIVKAQTAKRHDLDWQLLEPQVRIFGAAAEATADVYPAIKYLLAQVGDKQSLLLTPDLAGMFHVGSSAATDRAGALTVFALPDGAKLVLSGEAYDARVARVWNSPEGMAE